MDFVSLAPGDQVEITLGERTYTGVVRCVVQTSGRDYQVVLEKDGQEFPIDRIQVMRKLVHHLGF